MPPSKEQIDNSQEFVDKILNRNQFRDMRKGLLDLATMIEDGETPLMIGAQLSMVVHRFSDCYKPCKDNEQATYILEFLAASLIRTVNSDEKLRVLMQDPALRQKEKSPSPR